MTFIDIFLGVVSICGSALAVFVLVAEWKAFTHPRAQRQELPPEVRRQNDRNGIAAGLGLAVVVGSSAVLMSGALTGGRLPRARLWQSVSSSSPWLAA